LHLTLLLGHGVDADGVSRLAADRSLDAQPLSAHYRGGERRSGLLLGYGGVPPDQLRASLFVLREYIDAPQPTRGAGPIVAGRLPSQGHGLLSAFSAH
jgi:DNA-binding transcriptional MocR family regulator